jgi:thermitase
VNILPNLERSLNKKRRGERKMKKKMISFLLLTLILTSTLNVAFIIRSTFAQSGENNVLGNDFMEKINAPTSPNKDIKLDQSNDLSDNWRNIYERKPDTKQDKTLENSSQTSRYSGDRWNFNDTSEWSKFAYIDGNKTRLIVGINSENPTSLIELEKMAAKHRAKIVNTVSIRGEVRAVVVELLLASVTGFVEEVNVEGLANYIEPNMKVQAQLVPNDPYWSLQWGPQKIEADYAWNTTVGDPSVLVAVVDTGIDYTHPDLAANYVPLGYDWVNMDPDPLDDFGHGTHCAGIIAAVSNNNLGIAGLAQVRVMAEKVLDSGGGGYWDWIANGIINATDCGADIISMSLGGYGESELLHEAVRYAYDAGVLVIAAAGNDNTNMKLYPAGYDEVIAVAATDQNDNKASFSNWGDWIELAAPGVDIYSTMPTYHVTLNDWGYSMNYTYLSGTSMACPHVSGAAALVWSRYSNKTRDWVRLWLRYTADDLGDPGFDVYYGYGRVNARKAVEQSPPAHELIAYEWEAPPYVEPGALGTINATILNFGENNETDVTVQLFANGILVDSELVGFLAGGNSTRVSLLWNPTVEGLYNVTLYVLPVPGETSIENNVFMKHIYVGFPVKAVVLHSAGNVYGEIITNWQTLTNEWYLFGDTMVYIDYTTLNKDDITYEDIASTEADVLIISCASDPYAGWQFTDSEIETIEQYVYEGHGLIATAGTLYYQVPNNNKLAPLFGLNETTEWTSTGTDLLHLLNTTHPIFTNVPNPLVFPQVGTVLPYDGRWDSNELFGGKYLALGHYQESAIATYRGLVYISPWLETIPPYYHHHLQLLYNTITWSRYQKPEHELVVSLEAPRRLNPSESTLLNATVFNRGRNNETDVELQLFIDGVLVDSATIPELSVDHSYTLSYPWTPTVQGVYNVTAYAPPISGDEFTQNNIAKKTVTVLLIAVRSVLVYSDDAFVAPSSRYVIVALNNLGINYTYYADDPSGFGWALVSQPWDLVIVDHYNYYAVGSYWTELEEYVRDGGRLVLSTFDIDGSHSEPTTLWDTLGVRWVSNMQESPEPVYRWIPSHPIFTFPNTVGDITSYVYWGPVDYGDHVAATTGTPIAGFTTSPMEDYAAIVEGNIYPTVLFSFCLDDFRYDEDGDGKLDAIELWQNAIVYLARGFEHDLAVSLEAPEFLEPGDSVALNATVRNRGLSNETNVTLELIINGTIVDSELIPELLTGASHTIDYLWTPVEGTYNITTYAPPVSAEEFAANNVATKIVSVRPIKYVLFDQTHGTDSIYSYSTWVTSLTNRGYVVETHTIDPITPIVLEGYDVFVIPQAHSSYIADELSAIQNFVFNGGGLLVIGDDNPWIYAELTSFAGITWASGGTSGTTTDITLHPVTTGVSSVYLSAPIAIMYVTGTAQDLVRDPACNIMLAVSEHLSGKVLGFADEDSLWDYGIGQADNLLLANNMIDWLTLPRQEHDLAVTLDAPKFFELGNSTVLHATVLNSGLNNETDVELYLLINDTAVSSVTIPQLLVSEFYTINYTWTPISTGRYNITAYAAPVLGEEYVTNNVVTKWACVFFYTRLYLSHEWIGSGDPMGWHADDASWQYILPFDFPFYGVYYRTIYISSNGLITFLGPDSSCGNSMSSLAQKLAIAPAWDDWVTYEPYDVYIWQNSTHVGIRWYVAAYYNNSVVANLEAILSSDGVIQFNYEYNNGPVSTTVGISNGAGHILADDLASLNYFNTIIFDVYRHDVAIQDMSIHPAQVYAGQTVNINVTALNEGDVPESFNVTLYYTRVGNSSIPPEPHPGNSMWIEPSTTDLLGKPVGYKFNITLWVNLTNVPDPGSEVGAWQAVVVYNSALFNFSRYDFTARTAPTDPIPNTKISEWFKNAGTWKTMPKFDLGSFNATHNYVMPGELWLSPDYGEPENPKPGEGSYGSLVWIELQLISLPEPAHIDYIQYITTGVRRCKVFDENNINIAGTFSFYPAKLTFGAPPPPPLPPYRVVIGVQEVINLPPNSSTILTFAWNTTGTPLGTYFMNAIASVVMGEVDVKDNIYTGGTVELLSMHDVSIVNVSASRTWVYKSHDVDINVTVRNSGDFEENVTITVYYNITAGEAIGTQEVENLLPNESRTITLTWNTTGVTPCRNYTITAVAIIREPDKKPTDNIMESLETVNVRILGDANGDSIVDIADIYAVAVVFGEAPNSPRWNPDLDINNDGIIDIGDIYIVARNYGWTQDC